MNEHDSENIKGMLNMMQFTETDEIFVWAKKGRKNKRATSFYC